MFNKYYKNLRGYFADIEISEFLEIWNNFSRLNIQYQFLKIANFFERLEIKKIEIPVLRFFTMFTDFFRWKIHDLFMALINGKKFNLYGVTCYCGRQGSGKTVGVIEQLERIKKAYPECIVCTNINYSRQDIPLTSWLQLLYLRNGDKGVIFVIDEVQNNGLDWSRFPESLLQVITMQRKQKIKIFLTSQVYKNVVIQLRRQCFEVIECRTFWGRWTRHKCYDAEEYNNIIDISTPEKKMKMHKKWKYSFIQSNYLRNLYDTNQIVDTLRDYDKLLTDERVEKITTNNEKRLIHCGIITNKEKNYEKV